MPITTDFLKTSAERKFVGLAIGLGIIYAAAFIHEGLHWIFTVPFGGSLAGWHLIPPGWYVLNPAPEPWGTITFYSGGLGAGALLAVLLTLAIRLLILTRNSFWKWLGAPMAFGLPMEAFAGICEGAFNDYYSSGALFLGPAFLIGLIGVGSYWRIVPVPPENT